MCIYIYDICIYIYDIYIIYIYIYPYHIQYVEMQSWENICMCGTCN